MKIDIFDVMYVLLVSAFVVMFSLGFFSCIQNENKTKSARCWTETNRVECWK